MTQTERAIICIKANGFITIRHLAAFCNSPHEIMAQVKRAMPNLEEKYVKRRNSRFKIWHLPRKRAAVRRYMIENKLEAI